MSKLEVQAAPPDGAEVRDWAELHRDVLSVIFHKVGLNEVLLRTSKVCSPWRKAARDDPLLCRKIDMGKHFSVYDELEFLGFMISFDKALANLTKVAVNWGGNSVEELRICGCLNKRIWGCRVYNLLEDIAERARNLKSLSITECPFSVSIAKALGRLKQLEELEIVGCSAHLGLVKTIGTECPQLKRLKLESVGFFRTCIVQEGFSTWLGIPETMLQLEYLQLIRTRTTNEELMKILERCPNLETLDLRGSTKITVKYDDVRVRCSKIHNVLLPHDDISDDIYGYTDDDGYNDDFDDYPDEVTYDDYYRRNYYYDYDYYCRNYYYDYDYDYYYGFRKRYYDYDYDYY